MVREADGADVGTSWQLVHLHHQLAELCSPAPPAVPEPFRSLSARLPVRYLVFFTLFLLMFGSEG